MHKFELKLRGQMSKKQILIDCDVYGRNKNLDNEIKTTQQDKY